MVEKGISPESYIQTRGFTHETLNALEKNGYPIYTLTRQSIESLQKSGRKFWSSGPDEKHPDLEQFATLTSMKSQIAINPNRLFLEDSKKWAKEEYEKEQKMIVAKFLEDLAKDIPDVKVVIGEAPDYAELASVHFDATKEELFGKKHGYNLIVTKTLFDTHFDTKQVLVGDFHAEDGLFVGVLGRGRGGGRGHVMLMPLVVPA